MQEEALCAKESHGIKLRGRFDIVFLVDSTGSRKPCLDALKGKIKDLVTSLGVGNYPVEWRAKVVEFRDIFIDGTDWIVGLDNPFVSDVAQLESQVSALEPKGGGMGAEKEAQSGLDALWLVTHTSDWRRIEKADRLAVVLSDAPAKPEMHEDTVGGPGKAKDGAALAQFLAEEGFRLRILAPPCPVWKLLGVLPGSNYSELDHVGDAGPAGAEPLDWGARVTEFLAALPREVRHDCWSS